MQPFQSQQDQWNISAGEVSKFHARKAVQPDHQVSPSLGMPH